MDGFDIIILDYITEDIIDKWYGYCPPRVGDIVLANNYRRLVVEVVWFGSSCCNIFVVED